jgi:hypothetical protein
MQRTPLWIGLWKQIGTSVLKHRIDSFGMNERLMNGIFPDLSSSLMYQPSKSLRADFAMDHPLLAISGFQGCCSYSSHPVGCLRGAERDKALFDGRIPIRTVTAFELIAVKYGFSIRINQDKCSAQISLVGEVIVDEFREVSATRDVSGRRFIVCCKPWRKP